MKKITINHFDSKKNLRKTTYFYPTVKSIEKKFVDFQNPPDYKQNIQTYKNYLTFSFQNSPWFSNKLYILSSFIEIKYTFWFHFLRKNH